jgi:heme-degrading monooxygenase HmoA
MPTHHLAQINIGTLKAPMDAPATAGFAANLDRINALAEAQTGFVWRLTGEGNNATDLRPFDDPLTLINMSVWTNLEALAAFVYRSAHREIMRRRAEWFEKSEVFMCLWWVPAGHTPTPAEGIERLAILRRLGTTAEAFTFREPFAAPGALVSPTAALDRCA